jgi:hypothetical protein
VDYLLTLYKMADKLLFAHIHLQNPGSPKKFIKATYNGWRRKLAHHQQ